jgi:hypothetical protein
MVAGPISVAKSLPYSFTLTFVSGGSPVSLTGKTVYFTVKKYLDSDTTNAKAVIAKAITSHTNAAGGITTLTITPDDTDDMSVGTYYYDIQMGTTANDIIWSGNGSFKVELPTRVQ